MSVRGMRYRRPKDIWWDEEFEKDLELVLSSPQAAPLKWTDVFGNDGPVEIEIGFGNGRFLLESAEKHPDRNYLGFEWATGCFRFTSERAAKNELGNVRLVFGDVREFLASHIPENSISAYHIYFPDPWKKRRHLKRRLINRDFLDTLVTTLTEDGQLFFFTDHSDYFDMARPLMDSHTGLLPLPAPDPDDTDYIVTGYESKWRRLKRKTFRGHWCKSDNIRA